MKKFLLMLMTVFCAVAISAQTRTVTGVVTSADDGEPLAGVSVVPVGGNGQGTSTDLEGRFSLQLPQSVSRITVSYVGMETKTVDITPGVMQIQMMPTNTALDEVMVVAYGTAKKSEYTGSASVVKADQLENVLVTDATNALAGRVSGVQIQSYNGQPGSSPTVRIRGVGSINASSAPLYVVDGVPFNGDISQIPTQDIESMTVLKDAASTALYGARGANGVILITTKTGQQGKTKVTLEARWGVNTKANPEYSRVTDQRTYMELVYSALKNQGLYDLNMNDKNAHLYANQYLWSSLGYQTWSVPAGQTFIGMDGKFNPNATPGYVFGNNLYIADNWMKETITNRLRQEYNASISGGNDKLNYYLSFTYLDDAGLINGSSYQRLNTTGSFDYQVKKWLKVGANMTYTYVKSNYPESQTRDDSGSSGNAFYMASYIAPIYPFYVRNADGSIKIDEATGNLTYDYGSNTGDAHFSRNFMAIANPVGNYVYDYQRGISDIFRGKWYVNLTPVSGLNITGTLGYHVDNTQYEYYYNPWYGQFSEFGGYVVQEADRMRTIDGQVLAQYSKTFNDVHNMSIMAGWEMDDMQVLYVAGQGQNLYLPGNFTVSNAIDAKDTYGGQYALKHQAVLGRANYSYDGKYFAMVSVRRDGSSRFAPGKRWGTFWSLSAAWDIAKEKFMRDAVNVDMLKFKVSFGQNGNDVLGSGWVYFYPYQDFYSISGANGVWSDGTLIFKGNPDITWEKSNAFNIGFDYSFFQGKLSGTIEYFSRTTSDMLFNISVPSSLGYSSIPKNVGSMRNSGLELEINATPIRTKDWTWDINFNITAPSNKVIKLDPSIVNENGVWQRSTYQIVKEGESLYQWYLPQYAGVDSETGLAQYWAKDLDTGEEYLTANAVTARTTNQKATGNIMPKVYGGLSTMIKWKGLDISASCSYQLGGRIIDYTYYYLMNNSYQGSSNQLGQIWHSDILRAWTPENTITDVPRLNAGGDNGYANYMSDRWLTSSNYLSLNNVTIGYTFSNDLIKKIGLSDLRIYGTAENLAFWAKRKGMDPRQSFYSSEVSYSPIRTFSGGIRVSF